MGQLDLITYKVQIWWVIVSILIIMLSSKVLIENISGKLKVYEVLRKRNTEIESKGIIKVEMAERLMRLTVNQFLKGIVCSNQTLHIQKKKEI